MRANINREVAPTALMTFGDLVNHYRQTELLAENKTDKTRTTYLVYLRKWILPEWEREYLHNIKLIVVEQWLRSLSINSAAEYTRGTRGDNPRGRTTGIQS
jgi:hypothetical protein